MPSFNIKMEDAKVAHDIALRANKLIGFPILGIEMDVVATHVNGCPLKLQALFDAEDRHFTHDMIGISKFLNRTTGKLDGDFQPKYAEV